MSKFIDCWGKIEAKDYRHRNGRPVLSKADKKVMLAAIAERVQSGTPAVEAAREVVQEQLDGVNAQLKSVYDQAGETRYSTAQPFEQVMGVENAGAGKPLRSKATSAQVAKATYFDGSAPVTRENTTKAVRLAQEWNDPASAPDVVQRLLDANEGDALIIGTAQGELYRYALELAAKGQNHLLDFFNLTSNSWGVVGRNENIGVSEAATILAGRRDYSQSSALDAAKKVEQGRQEAEGKTLPPETSAAVTQTVTTTKLDKTAVRKIKSNVKNKEGETLEEKVEENVADVTAESLLQRFATSQSDTLSWAPKGKENMIRKLVREALTLGPKAKMWDRVWLINSLVELGVTPDLANRLTETVAAERKRRLDIHMTKVREREAAMEAARQEREAKRAAQLAAKLARANTDAAERIIDQLAELQSDPQINRPKPKANEIRQVVKTLMDQNVPMEEAPARAAAVQALVALNVEQRVAEKLVGLAWEQRKNNIIVAAVSEEERLREKEEGLAEGEIGSLRGLEDMIMDAPASQQQDPTWRYEAAKEYFEQLGLSPQRAAAAARRYSIEFGARLADALANAIERVASTSAPWQKKLKSVGAPTRKKLLTDMDKLIRAVRTGVTDPDTHWYNVVAQQNGWRGFTTAQHVRMNEIDEALQDPTKPDYQKKALQAELQDIVARAQQPPEIADYVVSSYTLSALSGLPTAFVQFSAPLSIARDFISDLPSNPVVATRTLIAAMDSLVQEGTYAGKTDVYNHQIGEHLRDSVPAMRQLLEDGLKNLQSRNPATKAKGAGQVFVGWQHFIGRMLSAIDEGAISAAEVYKTSLFTTRQLKAMGMTRDEAGMVVLASLDARNEAVEANMAAGMGRAEATVAANETFRRRIYEGVEEAFGEEAAQDIAQGAANEAIGMVGRLSEGVQNTDEGSLRTPVNHLLDALGKMYSQGGKLALGARLAFGFVVIPFRAAMWYSGYSPYGFIRYARHKRRQSLGLESHWKQSFGTRAQERQRLRDATIGSLAMLLGVALRSNSGDDDPDKSEVLKFIFTGKGPSDPVTRQAWNRRFQPYSLNVKIGKAYFSMNLGRAGESVAWPFALAGALDDVALSKKGKLARNPGATFRDIPELIGSYWGSLSQRSAFQGIGNTNNQQNAVEADNLFKKAVFTSSAFIPWKGAMSSVTRMAFDPVDNKTMSGVIFANTPLIGPILGRPALNNLGDPLGDRTMAGRIYREGVPLVVRFPASADSRVYDLILEQGRGPSAPRRSELERQYGPLSPEQLYQFAKIRGGIVKAAMNERFDKLRAMDSEQFGSALESITGTANIKAARAVGLRR
jgi:macrodomain Ter protein organizer (MatP/YcbG family)